MASFRSQESPSQSAPYAMKKFGSEANIHETHKGMPFRNITVAPLGRSNGSQPGDSWLTAESRHPVSEQNKIPPIVSSFIEW